MPYFRVTSHALLIEARNSTEAAMLAYRRFEDRNPTSFEVVGPDVEVAQVSLDVDQQEEAITIDFGGQHKTPVGKEA
jgi:hypothetical protein